MNISIHIKYILVAILLFMFSFTMQAQQVKGTVVDSLLRPIPDVTVVMQSLDSVYIDAVYTDSLGQFGLNYKQQGQYLLLFNHVYYKPSQMVVSANNNELYQMILSEKLLLLGEVSVVAEKPIMKIEGNILSYDAKHMMQSKVVTSAYEVVKEIPGVVERGEKLELIGSGNPHIVINGKVSTMSLQQVTNLLKNMPATKVKTVQVMYNPPAKYNVKGSLINIILDSNDAQDESLVGEVNASYRQSHYATEGLGTNLLYNKKNLKVDLLADVKHGKGWRKTDAFARHTLRDRTVEIDQQTTSSSKFTDFNLRLGADYAIDKTKSVSFSYYLENENLKRNNSSSSEYEDAGAYSIFSTDRGKGNAWLHNANMQFTGAHDLNLGAEYTNYYDPSDNHYTDWKDKLLDRNFLNNSSQQINKWTFYVNKADTIFHKLKLDYGVNGAYNSVYASSSYFFDEAGEGFVENLDMQQVQTQKEYVLTTFLETAYKFSKVVSLSASMKAEYFKTDYDMNGNRGNLWNEWGFYPNASLSFNFSPNNNLQWNFTSSKRYPAYWSVNPATTYLNSYSEIVGNPELKPQKTYRTQLVYVQNKKYMLIASASYMPDYFTQLAHQPADKLKTVFRYENYDYQLQMGLALIIPIKVKEFWDARLTLNGFRMHDRLNDFYGMSINKKKYVGLVGISNSFVLSKNKPDLRLQINANYQSRAIQGIYDLGDAWDLSSSVKWTISSKAHLVLQYTNILMHQMPRPITVDFQNQYSIQRHHERSAVKATFVWKFGNYKTPKHEGVDDSRMRR